MERIRQQKRQGGPSMDDTTPSNIHVGDLVWIHEPNPLTRAQKLGPRWTGPVKVNEITGMYYEVEAPDGSIRILHSDYIMARRPFWQVCGPL
jgi:hypothetical protein